MTLHGPGLQITLQTAALRGRVHAASRRRRRKKPSIKRRPKNVNMARKKAPRTNLKSLSHQRLKDQYHQGKGLSPGCLVLLLIPLQVSDIRHRRGDDSPTEIHGLTPDPTHPADPDLERGPDLIQDPGAILGLEAGLDLDHSPILDPDRDAGTDPDLCLHLERGVYPDLQESEKPASLNQMPRSTCLRNFQRAKSHLPPESLLSPPQKVYL